MTKEQMINVVLMFDDFQKNLLKQKVIFTLETGKWYTRLEKSIEEIRSKLNHDNP